MKIRYHLNPLKKIWKEMNLVYCGSGKKYKHCHGSIIKNKNPLIL